MQLDDVVSSTLEDPVRMEEAMRRSIRWLDRCIKAHARKTEQNLFPIVQGGLDPKLRTISAHGKVLIKTYSYLLKYIHLYIYIYLKSLLRETHQVMR